MQRFACKAATLVAPSFCDDSRSSATNGRGFAKDRSVHDGGLLKPVAGNVKVRLALADITLRMRMGSASNSQGDWKCPLAVVVLAAAGWLVGPCQSTAIAQGGHRGQARRSGNQSHVDWVGWSSPQQQSPPDAGGTDTPRTRSAANAHPPHGRAKVQWVGQVTGSSNRRERASSRPTTDGAKASPAWAISSKRPTKTKSPRHSDKQAGTRAKRLFFVFGEVRYPGAYRFTGNQRVLGVLSQVQPTRDADISRIRLLNPTPDGRIHLVERINLHRLLNHGDRPDNVRFGEGQVIYVPPTGLARISLAWRQMLGLDREGAR